MICFKKISIISYVPIAYSKVETIYFIFTFYMSETVFKSAGLGQLLLLLTFVVSYRISKLIITLILTWVDRIDYIIWHGASLTTTTGKICYYARCVNGYCACTLILRSGLFTLRYSNSVTVLRPRF